MSDKTHVLIIDDDPLVLPSLAAMLEKAGFRVSAASTAEGGWREILAAKPHVVVTDLNLPGMSGLELLAKLKQVDRATPVIVITAFGSIHSAVEAMQLGARDYVLKPINDFELVQRVRQAANEATLKNEVATLRRQVGRAAFAPKFIGRDPELKRVLGMVESAASTRATVLIRGESGTGKTLLARAIHGMSDRADMPFIEFSCGSLPDPLLESELFGHERGAFTGADRARRGKVEAAEGGTLFLDEITNATPALQMKLLRVLQDRTFERLGSSETRHVDVRLILATNASIEQLMQEGKFREDLFYRIDVIPMHLPPLRARRADIPPLVGHFLRKFTAEHGRGEVSVAPPVMAFLCAYEWPGNVRELENAIEHAVVLAQDGVVTAADLPARLKGRAMTPVGDGFPVQALKKAMEIPEREYIRHILSLNNGNRARTAAVLEVTRTTLFNKMTKYGLLGANGEHGAAPGQESR